MSKEFGNLTFDQLALFIEIARQGSSEWEYILEHVADNEQFRDLSDCMPPIGPLYQLPLNKLVARILVLGGLSDPLAASVAAADPQESLLEQVSSDDGLEFTLGTNSDEPLDEKVPAFLSLVFALMGNFRSLGMYAKTMDRLLEESRNDDSALFKAVIVDESVTSCPQIASRIRLAKAASDGHFMRKLSKAIQSKSPRRPAERLDLPRLAMVLLQDAGVLSSISDNDLYELLVMRLGLLPLDESEDLHESIRKLRQRLALNVKDMK